MVREYLTKNDDKLLVKIKKKHIETLNLLDQHLGCVVCRRELVDGRCPECQPSK